VKLVNICKLNVSWIELATTVQI